MLCGRRLELRNLARQLILLMMLSVSTGCQPASPPSPPAPATPLPSLAQGPDGLPWWNDTVFYEIFVRSFADSTTGPLAGDGIGDLQGIIEKLDYLQGLGVRGIWLTPIMVSPSYHGYDVADYYTVKPEYGANADFTRLMAEAHRRGIRIIVDLVLNHTSNQHSWFQEAQKLDSPYRDWYIWAAEDPGYRGPWGQQVWHALANQWYYGMFTAEMPDLNYRTPAVTEAMHKVAGYWLTEMGADGFRLDAVRYLAEDGEKQASTPATHAWLRSFRSTYKAINAQAMTVGEIYASTYEVARYVGDELDLAFEFDLANGMISAVNSRRRDSLAYAHELDLKLFPPGQFAAFLTNHDQNRAMTQFSGEIDRAKLAATLLLTGPGVPFIYYGEEIGMTGQKPDEDLRTPMQWTPGAQAGFSTAAPWRPVNAGYEQVNAQIEADDPASLLNHYRKLIALRNAHPALRSGELIRIDDDVSQVYAFLRQSPGETLLVLYNFSDQPLRDYGLTLASSQFTGGLHAAELLHGIQAAAPKLDARGGFVDYKPITELAPRTGYVIQLAR